MRVSKAEEYGIRLVASLAASGGQLTTRELAEREGLPEATVSKVVLRLRRAGLVEASRGRRGGYTLARPPAEITLLEVIETIEGPVAVDECVTDYAGECLMLSTLLPTSLASVTFTVTDVSGPLVYNAGDNHDDDGDSDGTSITIDRPD